MIDWPLSDPARWGYDLAIQLSVEDRNRLVRITESHPELKTALGRINFVDEMTSGSPRRSDVANTIDYDANPRSFSISLIRKFEDFGQDIPGRELLGVLINQLITMRGAGSDANFLRSLFPKYQLTTQMTSDVPIIGRWRGVENHETVLEKVIGENTLRDIFMVEALLDMSKSVVKIIGPQWAGTGFLVAQNLLITNQHVIPSRDEIGLHRAVFNYQLDRDLREAATETVHIVSNGLFYSNKELDCTIVEIEQPRFPCEPLALRDRVVGKGERVSIIQHPGGHYKKISMQNNFVHYADGQVVQYTTSTLPGSSGSPVIDDGLHVVALHHAGGDLVEPGSGNIYLRNEGISMKAILADLAIRSPDVLSRLVKATDRP
ncbi:trypsin-like peptidase domain-containing protein [Streptomyces nigra]|uniref:trypsin-like peptidase domain-containing protein n=1 Tax=Streptomyces nigra TaxID=1827580 RepID=UPI0036348256